MKRFLLLVSIISLYSSCGDGEDGLKEGKTDFVFFLNRLSYVINIEVYSGDFRLLGIRVPVDSDACVSESIRGYTDIFDMQAVYDSIKISFQDSVFLTSTGLREDSRFIDLENYSIEGKSYGH